MDHMARNWVNFVGHNGGRFYQNVWRPYKGVPHDEKTRAEYFVKTHRELARKMRQYGLYYLANLNGIVGGVANIKMEDRDPQLVRQWVQQIAAGLRDESNILGWFCGDEVGPAYLPNFLVTKALIETADRGKAAIALHSNLQYVKAYQFREQVIFTDPYRVSRPANDDPWDVLSWMTDISEFTGDKPHWATLQAHRLRKKPWYSQATPAEFSLMSWLAIAGGSNVNCYFVYGGHPWWWSVYVRNNLGESFWCCVDAYGNETPWFEAYKKFAEKIGPVGPLLARARLITRPSIKAVAPKIKLNGIGKEARREVRAVYLGVLDPEQIDGRVLIAVNMDRDRPRAVTISTAAGKRLYDLVKIGRAHV